MNGNEIGFYLSTSSSGGVPQTDPFASRGGYRSSTAVYHTESTLSGAMTAKDVAVDSSNSTTPSEYAGAWLLFVTGANAGHARKIASFDDGTGTFVFEQPFDALSGSGAYYRVHVPEAIFDDVDAIVCGAGQTDYRMIYGFNESSPPTGLTNRYTLIELLEAGDVYLDVSATSDATVPKDYEPDVLTEPDWDPPWLGATEYLGHWGQPLAFDGVYSQPPGLQDDWSSVEQSALWLRRIVSAATRNSGQSVYRIEFGFDTAGGDPDPVRSSFLIIFDVEGFNASIDVAQDRRARILGGCRVSATVSVAETGALVEDVPTSWSLDGPGSLVVPTDARTDENGEAEVLYHAPTDQGEAGNSVTFEVTV